MIPERIYAKNIPLDTIDLCIESNIFECHSRMPVFGSEMGTQTRFLEKLAKSQDADPGRIFLIVHGPILANF